MRARTHSKGGSGGQLGDRRAAWCGRAPGSRAVDTHVPDAEARYTERAALARCIGAEESAGYSPPISPSTWESVAIFIAAPLKCRRRTPPRHCCAFDSTGSGQRRALNGNRQDWNGTELDHPVQGRTEHRQIQCVDSAHSSDDYVRPRLRGEPEDFRVRLPHAHFKVRLGPLASGSRKELLKVVHGRRRFLANVRRLGDAVQYVKDGDLGSVGVRQRERVLQGALRVRGEIDTTENSLD